MQREQIFQRDGFRCVYCGQVFPAEELTVDHVHPRVRGGDHSGGNLVTACGACNTLNGHQRLSHYLLANPDACRNFFRYALHVWPRHLRALEQELGDARGSNDARAGP
jgi:hypothetical protein